MKKMFCVVLMTIVFMVPSVAHPQGFLFGVAAGAILFGGSNAANGGAMVLYVASEEMLKRVQNPLMVKLATIYYHDDKDLTLHDLFKNSLSSGRSARVLVADNYEILQVVRVFDGERPDRGAIWFCYIEKNQLAPPEVKK